jgi:trehalose-phosphatase
MRRGVTRETAPAPGAPLRRVSATPWWRLGSMLTAALRSGQSLLVLCDYDGTLTPVVADPGDAWLAREVRADLAALAESGRVHVGIVSGRALDDLRHRVGVPGLFYAGCHGLEIEGPEISFRHPAAHRRRDVLESVAESIRERTAALPGVVVEPKGLAVAIHYRHSLPADLPRLDAVVARSLRRHRGLRTLHGRKAIEILAAPRWDKGHCARWIRDHVHRLTARSFTTVCFGDDGIDELVFSALERLALTVKVGWAFPTLAMCRVPDIEDVHRVLSALAAEVGGGRAA